MRHLFRHLKPYRLQCILAPLFKMLEASFDLAVPLVTADIINTGIANGDQGYILSRCGILVLLALVGMLCSFTAQFFAARAAVGSAASLRRSLFRKIQSLDFTQIDTLGTGTLTTRMTDDVNQVQQGVNLFLRLFLRSPFVVFGAVIMAFTLHLRAALIFAAVLPVLTVIIVLVMRKTAPLQADSRKALDKTVIAIRENLTGVRVVRAFGQEEREQQEFDALTEDLFAKQHKTGRVTAMTTPLTGAVVHLGLIGLIWLGGIEVNLGGLQTGTVIALVSYMNQILTELVKLANLTVQVTKAMACAGRVGQILDMKEGMPFPKEAAAIAAKSDAAVAFDHVSLCYAGAGAESLTDISFTVKRGEVFGIMGGTGSGKTSVINLIPRFYDATQGEVTVLGTPVRNWGREELRRRVMTVMQQAVLFSGTIRSNLLWGCPDASDEALWAALEAAQAADFVRKAGGLDAAVEQGGRNFSGGQKQRLNIARAMVGQPDILILDDSASALDAATEKALRQALETLRGRTTLIIVSGRFSALQQADSLLVLEDGTVAGLGTHSELAATSEVYREIVRSQGYELPESASGKEAAV